MKSLILVTCVILFYCCSTSEGNSKEVISKAVMALDKAAVGIEKINAFMIKVNAAQMFAKISTALVYLGPALMAASAVLSIVAIFLPQEDSAELKAITAGFEKVNLKLDIITVQIRDLKNIVELSSAKSAYVKCMTSIQVNFENLEDAKKENEKASYDYFVKQYELTYNLAATNLFDVMTGKLGIFGFNLVNLYKDYVKCNPMLISQFCTLGMQTITKGLITEGAYLGALNLTSKTDELKISWEVKLQTIADSCQATIKTCEDNWKVSSSQHLRETYNENLNDNNEAFAKTLANALNDVVPQKSWLVAAYNDAAGFGEHAYSAYYEKEEIWNEHNKDVTVFSAIVEEPKPYVIESAKNKVNVQLSKLSSAPNCRQLDWMPQDYQHFGGNDLRTIINFVKEGFFSGVVYVVQKDKNPGFAATGNTFYQTDYEWKCTSKSYRVATFN